MASIANRLFPTPGSPVNSVTCPSGITPFQTHPCGFAGISLNFSRFIRVLPVKQTQQIQKHLRHLYYSIFSVSFYFYKTFCRLLFSRSGEILKTRDHLRVERGEPGCVSPRTLRPSGSTTEWITQTRDGLCQTTGSPNSTKKESGG